MTCTVTSVNMLDVVRLTLASTSSMVANNDVITQAYSALSHYHLRYHVTSGTATLQLRIRGTSTSRTCLSVCLFTCLFRSESLFLAFLAQSIYVI